MLILSLESCICRYASSVSLPSTEMKQSVVCPIPDGNTLSLIMAFTTVLLPLLVLQHQKCEICERVNLNGHGYNITFDMIPDDN